MTLHANDNVTQAIQAISKLLSVRGPETAGQPSVRSYNKANSKYQTYAVDTSKDGENYGEDEQYYDAEG